MWDNSWWMLHAYVICQWITYKPTGGGGVLILIGNVQSLSSLIILVAWEIWKHKNAMVFEGATLNIQNLLLTVANESSL